MIKSVFLVLEQTYCRIIVVMRHYVQMLAVNHPLILLVFNNFVILGLNVEEISQASHNIWWSLSNLPQKPIIVLLRSH